MNEILDALAFDPKQGSLNLRGTRYLLIRPETLAGIRTALGPDAADAFAAGGREGGGRSAAKLMNEQGLEPQQVVEKMCEMGTKIGWGRLVPTAFEGRTFSVEVFASPFAEGSESAVGPVCDLLRGVFEGIGRTIFGKDCRAVEKQCRAVGASSCQFVVEVR